MKVSSSARKGGSHFRTPRLGERLRGIVVTCEHATNHVPIEYRPLFRGAGEILRSHRGWDPGAIELARDLAHTFRVRVLSGRATRLLVDLNRTARSSARFSEFTRKLPEPERARIIGTQYDPHWEAVTKAIADSSVDRGAGAVLHIAAHTFVPVLAGKRRRCDVGLLYDPRRRGELLLAQRWQAALRALRPDLVVLRNQPYRGWSDGMTTWFRGLYPPDRYWGIEIEVSQRWIPAAPDRGAIPRGRVLLDGTPRRGAHRVAKRGAAPKTGAAGGAAEWRKLRTDIIAALVACLGADFSPSDPGRLSRNPAD